MANNLTVYRSSAGSGKTHTLVKEYIKLAISGNDYAKRFSKILAITFTNKAAGEMKERVIRNLYTLKSEPGHKDFNQHYMDEMTAFCGLPAEEMRRRAKTVFATMLHNYHLLKITTIDKFTVSLVYSFARDLNIDADHEIVTDVNEVIDAGIEMLLEQSGKDKELTAMFVDFLGFEMDEGNRFNAKKELRKFCSKVMDEKGYEALELASEHSEKEFIDACKLASTKVHEIDNRLKNIIESVFTTLKQNNVERGDFHYKGKGNYSWFEKIYKKGFYEIVESSLVTDFINGKRWQKKLDAAKQAAVEKVEEMVAQAMVELLDLKKRELRNYIVHSTVRKNAFSMALFKRLHATITDYKTSNSIILLSEFTQLVSNIVADEPAPFIYERLGERVKNIFVDEFQDTSTLQFSNLVPLMENSLSTEDFVMIVGDAKQSIYRWRNGNVEQFVDLPELPVNATANHPYRQGIFTGQYCEKNLPVNYRSLKNVVEFNNVFFEEMMKHPNFVSDTLTLAYKDIKQEFRHDKQGGYVEFDVVLKKRSSKKNLNDEFVDEDESDEEVNSRIDFTVRSIQACLANGYSYSDIAILIRTHKEGEKLFSGLRKHGIPVVSNQALSLQNSQEIKSLMTFFKCLQLNAGVTSFKHFAFTYARFINLFEQMESQIAKLNYASSFDSVLGYFNLSFNKNTFDSLNLFEQLHYIAASLCLPQNNSFLAAFFELAFGFFRKNGSNAQLFIEWWDQKADSFKLQTGQNSDSVKIVTIHKSKGLQYPVVILPYISATVKNSDKYFWMNEVPGYSIKPLPVQYGKILENTEWNKDYETEKRRSAFDVLNVLYVAFTRAEEQLFCYTEMSEKELESSPIALALKKAGWNSTENKFRSGSPVTHKKKPVEAAETILRVEQPDLNFVSWYNKLQVSSFMVNEKYHENALQKKGILTHAIASTILTENEIDVRIDKSMRAGMIDEAESTELKALMGEFYASEVFRDLEKRSISQLTEIEITDGKGNVNRPDRVFVLPGNESVVVDLKTGEEDAQHNEQVRTYMQLLTQAGYPSATGWLYYFKTARWIKVQ